MQSIITYAIAVICVIGIAFGQIIFKLSAISLKNSGSFFAPKTLITLGSAFLLYGTTTILWVWVLQRIELGRVYPIMALAFVLVPLSSYLFLGERFQTQYYLGVGLILVGIIIVVRSS